MKNKVLLTLILLILGACTHRKTESSHSTTPSSTEKPKIFRPQKAPLTSGVFHIIHPERVELVLQNLGTKKVKKLIFNDSLSQIELAPGHWQVNGFSINGQDFEQMNTSKKFIFQIKTKKTTYAGSYIFQCPKVTGEYLREMKKMTFFNRYPFRSKTGLCELVVGSAYDIVNKVWVESDKEHRALNLGF